jgi:hypothetical protein
MYIYRSLREAAVGGLVDGFDVAAGELFDAHGVCPPDGNMRLETFVLIIREQEGPRNIKRTPPADRSPNFIIVYLVAVFSFFVLNKPCVLLLLLQNR